MLASILARLVFVAGVPFLFALALAILDSNWPAAIGLFLVLVLVYGYLRHQASEHPQPPRSP